MSLLQKIDRLAVARDIAQSERDLTIEHNGTRTIKGRISQVYCLPNGDRWSYSGGAYAVFQGPRRKPTQSIGVDRSAAIAEARQDELRLQNELAQAKREDATLDGKHTAAQKSWNEARSAARRNDDKIDKLQSKIVDLKEEEHNSTSHETDLSDFETDVQTAKQKLEDIQRQAADLSDEQESLQPKVCEIEGQLDERVSSTSFVVRVLLTLRLSGKACRKGQKRP